jgi:hypothetical protein
LLFEKLFKFLTKGDIINFQSEQILRIFHGNPDLIRKSVIRAALVWYRGFCDKI